MTRTRRLFRSAVAAPPARNLVKTAAQIVIVWSFALVLLPAIALRVEDAWGIPRFTGPATVVAGAVLLITATILGLVAAALMAVVGQGTPVPFDAARQLVIAGPYRVVRNPMAISAVAQLLGIALIFGSPLTVGLAGASGLTWNMVVRPAEEAFLAECFGPSFERYRASVGCWVPRWPPYRGT